jgi:hypothetical protein
MIEMGPTRRQPYNHPPGSSNDLSGNLDQPSPPRACEPFTQRIAFTSLVEESLAMWLVDRGGRQLARQSQLGGRWGQHDNGVPQPHQQVQRSRMKIQTKKVGHEPVVAQAIGLQLSF